MALHPQRQGLDALEEEERVERTQARTDVAQTFHPCTNREGDVPERTVWSECLCKPQAVVAGRRFGERRESAVRPVEVARVDDDPTNRRAVTTDPFRRRSDDDVCAMVDR